MKLYKDFQVWCKEILIWCLNVLVLMGCAAVTLREKPTLAQSIIVPDNSLGAESSNVAPLDNIGSQIDVIDGGAIRGVNLFHSFKEFNVGEFRGAYFQNPSNSIQNILTRVTGQNRSEILGTLGIFNATGVRSNPNLYLINPNGIVFGKNAGLDIQGSFVGTTANALEFGNQGIFSATKPEVPQLLTINPSALLFNQINQNAAIVSQSRFQNGGRLFASPGKSLLLAGGNVNLDGTQLFVAGGRIEVGGLSGNGSVKLIPNGNALKLGFSDAAPRADVLLQNNTQIFTSVDGALGGGDIAIYARNLDVVGDSLIRAGVVLVSKTTSNTQAGDITLDVTETLRVGEESRIANVVDTDALVNAGNIRIKTGALFLSDDARLNTTTFGQGNGGNIFIEAVERVSLDNALILAEVKGTGNGGNIRINTGLFSATNGSALSASVYGKGNAGNIIIDALDSISLGKDVRVLNGIQDTGAGIAGNISLNTGSLFMTDNASVTTFTEGNGKAGEILVNARNQVALDANANISNFAVNDSGGNIKISTGNLFVNNGSLIDIVTFGKGDAGNIQIEAKDSIFFNDAKILNTARNGTGNAGNIFLTAGNLISLNNQTAIANQVRETSEGKGGNININTFDFILDSASILQTITAGKGSAGNIIINADNRAVIKDSIHEQKRTLIVSTTGKGTEADAGNIEIKAGSLEVTQRALINTITEGKGNAGDIILSADNIWFDDTAAITRVAEDGIGNSGNIEIKTGLLRLTNGGQIDTSIFGVGNSGNLTVNARDILIDGIGSNSTRPSSLFTEVVSGAEGNGGDLRISTGSLIVTNGGKLEASTRGKGKAGNIFVTADSVLFDGRNPENSSGAFSSIEPNGVGFGGNIKIDTNTLAITNGAQIGSGTEGQGDAGSVFIDAKTSVSLARGAILNTVAPGANGNGGSINIVTKFLSVTNESIISSETQGQGSSGNVIIKASDRVFVDDSFINSSVGIRGIGKGGDVNVETGELVLNNNATINSGTFNRGNGGDINIATGSLLLDNDAWLSSTTNGQGNAGNIFIQTRNNISLDNDSVITSLVNNKGVGRGGDIRISTGEVKIAGAAQIDTSTFGEGDAGNVTIEARGDVFFTGKKGDLFSGIWSSAEKEGRGNGGNVFISGDSVVLADGAAVSTPTEKEGNAGNIDIQARNQVTFRNGAYTQSITLGQGKAGNVSIKAGGQVTFTNNTTIESSTAGKGSAGNISIEAESLLVTNGSLLRAITNGVGNGGDILINTTGDISLFGLGIDKGLPISSGIVNSVAKDGIGDAGDIRINARNLSMADNSVLKASTEGQGNSGNIFINTSERVSLDSRAIISNIVGDIFESGKFGNGTGGIINIETGSLSMLNGAQLQASTFGNGDAGDIFINARDSFRASGFGTDDEGRTLSTAVFSISAFDAKGDGGDIRIKTGSLFVEDGAKFNVETSGQGRAGNIVINARDSVVLDGISKVGFLSAFSTATQNNATGQGGTITVNTNSFRVSNGAVVNAQTTSAFKGGDITFNSNLFEAIQGGQVITTATNSGQAGNITVNADSVLLSGDNIDTGASGLFANTDRNASAQGGNVQINARELNIADRAKVSVNSQGSGIAGNIDIKASTINMSDNASIIAETTSQDGGSINISDANLIFLRRNSLISATAGEGGNGGNVDIISKYIVGVPEEDSDIRANAFRGRGGNVRINSQGIFGIESRPKPTNKSDITASSEQGISGVTVINAPETSSIQNTFTELPSVIDTNALIANSCISRSTKREENSFTVTGSSALRNAPRNGLNSVYSTGDVRSLVSASRTWKKGDPIVEPQGLYKLPNGQLLLSRSC